MKRFLPTYISNDYSLIQNTFRALAIISVAGHLLFHIIIKYIFGFIDPLSIRLIVSLPALVWLLFDQTKRLNAKQILYFELSFTASLPFLFSCFLFLNNFNVYWLASQFFAAILFGILVKPIKALLFWPLGFMIAIFILQYYFMPEIDSTLIIKGAQVSFGAYFLMFIAGIFQTIFININEQKDQYHKLTEDQNKTLAKQKQEIIKQKNDILKKNNELHYINEKLENSNKELYKKNEIIEAQHEKLEESVKKLKDTQSQLIHTEKMASLGTLTAGVAHEINNPLNYIMGAYEGLVFHYKNKSFLENHEETGLLINALKEGLDRSSSIMKGLNQFSRNIKSLNEECNLHKTIDNCLTILYHQHKHYITIQKNFCNSDLTIKGNVGDLHQVFISILSNSIQAISEYGAISITSELRGGNAIIVVADDGEGIRQEHLKRITDPFFTTKAPGEGTGLGLSITYNIINEHKGTIDFESELGKGTTVKITLPIIK